MARYLGGSSAALASRWLLTGVCVMLVLACAPTPSQRQQTADTQAQPTARKRVTALVMGDVYTLSQTINNAGSGGVPGVDALQDLVHAGLGMLDGQGIVQPRLAEAVPSAENGLWKVFPDATMETTWRIRPGVRWHDGTALTSEDLLFTFRVAQDKDLTILSAPAFEMLSSIEAIDAQTIRARWRTSYIDADKLFSAAGSDAFLPLPKHLLERTYQEDKALFTSHPYWGSDYVGAGPFRLRDFVRGSHMILDANDTYVLGRPKIDEIEVKFIPDPNAAIANLFAGAAELTFGRRISLDQAVLARERWKEGRVDISFASWIAIFPQFLNPTPAVITDAQFRRALLHATDRQQLVDTLQFGMVPVADSLLNPGQPQYKEIEDSLPRFDYDPRRSAQLIEGLGYTRGNDGFFRDSAGQRLVVELQTNSGDDLREKTVLATADYWQRAGVGVDPVLVPLQLRTNREYKSTRPGFELVRQPNDVEGLPRLHGSAVPLAENNYRGDNRARYKNSEYDALVDRYFTTIPVRDRVPILADIVRHVTENVVLMGLFYGDRPILIGNRLKNVHAAGQASSETWNAHEWEAS